VSADEFGHPALQVVVPAASGETEELNVSPSTQASNDANGEVAFRPEPANAPRSKMSKMSSIVRTRRFLPGVLNKSRAAHAQLREADDDGVVPSQDYDPEVSDCVKAGAAPSVADHSVGEDTMMLYPTINRGRAMSRDKGDNMSNFDGYSMDGMSAVDGGLRL